MSNWKPDYIVVANKKRAIFVATIDHEDADSVMAASEKWYPQKNGARGPLYPYSRTPIGLRPMHRIIMGPCPSGKVTDHINRDGMDNRRTANLRFVTLAQNSQNRGKFSIRTSSRFIGVSQQCGYDNWKATIVVGSGPGRKSTHLGYFKSEEAAALAYDRAARNIRGEFAVCNFPESGGESCHS